MRHGLAPESGQEQAQENSEPGQEAPGVISGGGEHGVDGVAVAVGEEVAVHAMIVFGVSDDRLDGGAAFEVSSDGVGDAALLALRVNLELVLFRGVMAFVAASARMRERTAPVIASMPGRTVSSVCPS